MPEEKLPTVPETFEGWAVLHDIYRVKWPEWKKLTRQDQKAAVAQAQEFFHSVCSPRAGSSALFSLLGHKGDLLFLHFRPSFDELNQVERGFQQLSLCDFLEKKDSYLSCIELGVYEMTVKLARELAANHIEPGSEAWNQTWKSQMAEQREKIKGRLETKIPSDRYLCFYPMNKRRGEEVNWYSLPIDERQRMMRDHGMIGRKYGDRVSQVITGSIGFDNWEWGVYLFAKEPVVFKKLVYEMRFDEASAKFGEFGPFFLGLQFSPDRLEEFFSGTLPQWPQ